MAERPLYTLYKNLKAQNYDVPDDYNKFESALTRDGKGGADNRHAIYENLKAQNFDVPNTYERFYSALFEPRSKTSSRAKGGSVPMSAADRARFSAGAAAISASAQHTMNNAGRYNRLKQRKQKQQKDFGRVNLGTHQTPYGGDANNVVKDDFAYNPETGKTGAYVSSDNENVYSQPEAEQKQAVLDQQNNAYQEAVDTGEIPSVFDVRDKNGNYDLQENINKNGTYLTEEGARNQFDKKLADAYARKKEIKALIAEDHRQHGNPLLSYGASIGASNGRTAEQSDYSNKLATSLALVKQQIGALEALKQYPTSSWGEDALKALDNTAFTAKTWDFGLTDFATMGQMERIKTKMDNNLPLSGSDKMLLKSKLGADAAAALEDEKMGNIYRWTKIAGQSLPFMADFFLTGGYGGITKAISRGALKFAAKRGMGKVSAAILKNTGIVAGDVIGSYAMAGSEQAMKTGADIMQRHLGSLYQDEKGDYKFGTFDENGNLLHEGGESMGTALYKGLTSAMVENYTEKLFGHSYGIKKGAINFMEKHGMNASAEFFKNIGKSGWYTNSKKWMEKFGINGFGEEVMEEEIGIPLHALLDGDNKFSDLLDTKQQLDIIGGMALSVGSMYAMGAGSRPVKGVYNRAQYYRFRNKVNVADSDAQNLMGDKWADIKDKIDNTTNEQMGGVLADILRQRDTMSKEQINAAINYGINLMKMRGYNVAKTAEMNAREITNEPTTPEEQHQEDIDNAYSEGHDADDADKHDIQLEYEDQMKTLAGLLNISEQQLSAMNDDELQSLTGQNDKLDQAIYDYQLSSARYQGVTDDAQDKIDMAANQAAQRVDMYTDKSRGSVRNATVKASGGAEDYGVYIISGNIATNEDGSINVADSDDMILFYDPTTNSVEHADALRFAELGDEVPADDVKAQAVADAKEKAIKEVAGIVDGTIDVGSQFKVTGADGLEHTYEILADYGDGTAAISIDGNVVENPYSLEDLQQLKDLEDQKRLEAAKTQREQMEKERAEQQTQETELPEETQPSLDFNQILNDNGNVVLVDVLDKDGNTKYPDSKLFLIRDTGAKAKVVEMKSDGTFVPHAVSKKNVATISSMSLDEYKQAMAETSMIEENSGAIEGDRGGIEVNDELPPVPDNVTINGDGTYSVDGAVQGGENTTAPAEQTEQTPAMTLEDGTIVPMLEDGNPDFSKLTADQTAELYDSQFGEDADSVISGWVSDAKKALDKANNMTVKGKNFVEQKAAKEAKEKAIADAQTAYDSAVAIRDAYNERQLAKVEDTADGRKNLIEKARRKYNRLKSAVKDDAEAVSQLYKDVVGSLLHRLYDGTGIDVTDTIPLTAEEYVASNLGAHSLNYEGTETSKGVKQETGLSREDFAKTQLLAADGKGTTIDDLVHSLWENRPSNLESLDTQDIRNALIGVLNSGFRASEARNYIENLRIAQAENILEEQKKAADNAAFAEEQTSPAEEQTETALESEQINDEENEQTNEQNKFPDKLREGSKAIEVPEDATEENPLGAQRDQTDLPFSAKENGKQQTTAERAADVEKNKVDDMKVVDNIVGEKTRKAFERLAKMMGAKIQWQYSDKLGNGWIQETKDADGNVHRTIFITLDSSITEGAQFIFGHEMTHQIKNLNPAAYNELTQLVLDTYGADAFDKAVDETMQRYSDAGFSGRARDYYAEEVVADAVGEMIRDLNLAHTLAMKMSHPLLAAIHEILQKIKLAFFGTEYSYVTKNIIRSIEQAYVKTAKGVSFSLRQKPEPKKKGIGYKVFVLKDGKLYPPMIANPDGAATPVGVWLDADAAPIAGESKTGRPQVKQGGNGTQGGSGKLAYRPGWHLGVVPYAIQFNRKDADGNKTLFPKNFVFAEVEYAADVDYQEEARQEGINPSGKYQHSLAGLKHLPTDGYYMYRTNPNPETDPWVITGAMKVNRILTRAEQAELVKNAGREPQQIQDGDIVTDDVVNSINQEIADAPKFSLKVYHGTGADFTEFDFDHMGEGEGSQAFGWGGYVTSSEEIGEDYTRRAKIRKDNGGFEFVTDMSANNKDMVKQYIYKYKDVDKGLDAMRKDLPDALELFPDDENIKELSKVLEKKNEEIAVPDNIAYLYDVDIPDDNGSNYLKWDKKVPSKILNKVNKGLESIGKKIITPMADSYSGVINGEDLYKAIASRLTEENTIFKNDKAASKFLSSIGFTGVKYPAGTIFGGAKKGDTNYVIFKPEDMRITEHTKFSIKTYHGSQASFDKFDHSFMGSGEGAQAYGWGTYVSEVEGIAKAYAKSNATIHSDNGYKEALYKYREADFNYHITETSYKNAVKNLKEKEQLAHPKIKNLEKELEEAKSSGDTISVGFLETALKNWNKVLQIARKEVSKYEDTTLPNDKDVLEKAKKRMEELMPERNLYSVDIPDDTGRNYIGWDEPLGAAKIMRLPKVFKANGWEYKKHEMYGLRTDVYTKYANGKELEGQITVEPSTTGGELYKQLASDLGVGSDKAASEFLSKAGFVGVKVIAQRNAGGNKDGRMNYVIFDENNAQITSHTKFSLKKDGMRSLLDVDGKPVVVREENGNVDLNYRTWQDEKELVRDALVTDAGLEEDEADAMIAQADVVADAMKSYMDKYPRFRDYQYAPAGNREIIRDNGDYLSWDYSFNCIKKDAMNAVMDKLVSLGKSSHLGVTQVEAIKKILQKHKFLTPCVMCYVEGKRKVLKQSKADAQKWNSVREYAGLENKEMGEPTELTDEQQTALKNLSNGKAHIEGIDDYSVQKIANLMLDNDILRGNLNYEWMMSPSSFTQMYNKFGNTDLMKYMTLGQYRGKQLLEATPFSINNIPRELYLKMYSALELKERGGLRQFSYEDARAMMFFDYYTQFLLMQGARSPEHLYTKRPFMPEMFGKTGAMINQSLIVDVWGGNKWHQDALGLSDSEYDSWLRENAGFIPRGALPADNADYKEGSTELVPAWSVESFPLDKAMENIHNRDFKGNVGNTIVAPSHKFIQWALDNPDIHMILAYHAAGGSPIMKALSGYDKATAMDDGYHTLGTDGKAIKTIEDKLTGVEISGGALQWNRLLRKNGYDAKKAAQTYLDFCKENGFTPMFNYEGVVDHPNYYKMLTDFRVYDEDGKSIRQKGVKAVLPDNWQEILNKYLEQEQTSSEQVSKVTLDENIMKEIDAATKFTSIELEERDSIMSLLQKIYGKGNVEVLGQNEFDVSLDGATSDGRAQMLRDMGGMVYGYAAGNRIVLNEHVFNANTPLHEHAHLYMKVLSAFNPRLYQRGMELWRDTPQWNDAKSDIERLDEEPTDDRVFSECMAQFTGTANEDIISKVTGVTDKNWIQKALEWMKEMWDGVKSAFKRWAKGDLDALTADDFAHLPLRAFYDTEERNAYIKNVKALNDAGGFDGSIRFSLKEEKEKIVADAKANGTYMTAPNGEKTKLDAEQWATVRTTNFKNWFGDWENDPENASKVVDENGEPMVMYHYTDENFTIFGKDKEVGKNTFGNATNASYAATTTIGHWFTSNKNQPEYMGKPMECFLNIVEPFDGYTLEGLADYLNNYISDEDFNSYEEDYENVAPIIEAGNNFREEKIKDGYDGVVIDDEEFGGTSYVAFNANQIKSAENNNGDFSADNNDIRFSLKAMMEKPEGWKQANKKAIHIAEAIERDPKFSLKNLDGTLIKAGTYFSGGGLVEEGLKGIIDPVVAVEYDEKISGVYRNNFGQHIVTADVRDVDPKELVKQIDGEVEYFHASPVCKNYSQAKSNHAEVELDKETADSTAEFINAVKPKVVTIENVKGYKDSEAMKIITDALDANGYTWDADVYNAADYGGYTNRERLIVRAVRDGKLPEKPKKMARKSGWYEAVADIIPTLTEKKNGVANWMDIRLKADGIDWRNIDKPLYVMGSAYADGKIPHAFADELLPTLRTKSGDVIVMPDGKVYRAMGRVLARVSGVSDDYKMPFSENLSHTIIGNGIPTQLTEHVIAPLLQNTLRPTTPDDGSTKFSLRYDKFEHDLNQWKKDNNLPKDAQRPTIPQRNAGESAVDFLRRVDEYRKQMALWKTAPTYEQHLLSDDTALGEFNRELQRGSVLKRIAFQDSMLAIRKAQEAIMKEVGVDRLNMAEDAYTAENRSHGKGKNEFEEYNNEFLQPLRKAYHQMKKVLGDSYDNVRVYMMAKHGLERDAQMAFKKSLEADYEDVNQRSAAYKAYKNDLDRVSNDADLEFGRVDFTTWRQKDNALRGKYSPSYMDYRYDDNGIAYDYSGLSSLFDGSDFEETAHRLVRDVETKHLAEVQALWNATNAATKKILRDGFKAGMMSKDAYEYVKGMYSHYIPLRGWDGTTADQVWDYIGGGKGAFNQTLKTAHGRTSIADDPIAYIENMAESGILLNNKNWVKQHLMLLAQNHPTSLLTLSKAWYVKSTDANGNEEWIPATPQITSQMNSNQVKAAIDAFEQKMEQMAQTGDATQQRDGLNIAYPQTHSEEREHEVRVMKDGEEYVIYVNGDPQLAQAMNNTRAHRVREIQSGKLDRAAAWLGRKMAAAYTSLSPLFIPSNYFRDLTMTLASTAIREDGRYNYLLRKNLATSWNLGFMLKDYQNGKLREKVSNGNATAKEQMFYDFMMNGGETGFVSSLDVEDLKKKFKNDLKDLDRWKANPVKVGHTFMDGIEFLNRAIEDSNRFAVYMTSIQYGRSIDEAVNDAKDVTLNFNRKGTGEYGWQMIRNLYLFINPAVQSLQTLGALTKHHPFKFTAVTAAWLASGVLVPIVNAALMSLLGGDDDKDKYWQFSKWDRRNNAIMWIPFTNEYVKIPLAQEFRTFYGVGDMIASKMMGGELAEETWSQYAEDLLGQVVDMLPLDPTGYDGNIAVSLMPNPIRPVFELAFNVDFTGKPLFKDTEYNKYDPNFTKAYVGTPDWLVRVSKMVNSIGNDYPDVQQNAIDAFGDPRYNLNNPAVVDHVLSSYLGGAYTMGSQVLGVLTKSLNDPKEIKMADIPLVSKFVSNPDDRPVTKKQGDEFWNMKENHDRAANTLSKLKKQAKVDGDYSMLERFYGSEEYKLYKQEDVKVKKYEEDKKKERAEESGEEYRPHKLNAEDVYKAHATPQDDFEDLKLKQLFTKLNGFKTSYDLLVDTAPGQSDGYYNTNKAAIDAIDEISLDKQEISELKKGFLEDGKDAYNAEDMKRIRELRKRILSVLEPANKMVVANQKAKAEKK